MHVQCCKCMFSPCYFLSTKCLDEDSGAEDNQFTAPTGCCRGQGRCGVSPACLCVLCRHPCHRWGLIPRIVRDVKLIIQPQGKGKKKETTEFFFAHGNFVDHLLSYILCMIWKDSSFYLDSHQDRNSNKTPLTSATKVTLFPQPLLNFGSISEQINPMKFSLSNFRLRRSVVNAHFSFGQLCWKTKEVL